MGISLTGLTPATTYDALIKVGDNGPITGALKVLSDGLGTNLPMEASTTGINFTGVLTQAGTTLQPTLVSGTNIKTINGTSVLGSGDIVTPSTSPSGVAGAIQFSNGSAFASDATNFFWDDANNRLGIGTNSPASPLSIVNTIALTAGATNPRIENIAYTINNSGAQTGTATGIFLNATETALNGQTHNLLDLQVGGVSAFQVNKNDAYIGQYGSSSTKLYLNGTNGTRAYLGTSAFQGVLDMGSYNFTIARLGTNQVTFSTNGNTILNIVAGSLTQFGGTTSSYPSIKRNGAAIDFRLADDSGYCNLFLGAFTAFGNIQTTGTIGSYGVALINSSGSINASAALEVVATTKGFLPPRMTTTQKNAIATPAAGLVVYDSTTNKLCCYNGSTWNDLF